MLQICWQWSQNVHHVSTFKNQNSLPCEMLHYYGYAAKTVSQRTLTFSTANPNMLHIANYSEFEFYLFLHHEAN